MGVMHREATEELLHIARDRPRSALLRVAMSLGISAAYLVAIWVTEWDEKYSDAHYLALFALSGILGSVVCVNSLCFDARRVSSRLGDPRSIRQVLTAKNAALFLVTFCAGSLVNGAVFAHDRDPTAFITSTGALATMILVWLGVGNVLSVVMPLRVEPLSARRHDGTWKPFLFSFAVSYVVGLMVNGMLLWRAWAKGRLAETVDGVVLPTVAIVVSALVTWSLLTALAVVAAARPSAATALEREVVPYTKASEHDQKVRPPL